jgi:hypothetical protein
MAKIAYYLVCALIIVTIGMLMVGCEQVPKIKCRHLVLRL